MPCWDQAFTTVYPGRPDFAKLGNLFLQANERDISSKMRGEFSGSNQNRIFQNYTELAVAAIFRDAGFSVSLHSQGPDLTLCNGQK